MHTSPPPARRFAVALVPLLAFTAVNCASALEHRSRPPTRLIVENRNWEDMDIFVVRADAPIRVGQVASLDTRVFVLNSAVFGTGLDVRLLARPTITRETFLSHGFIMPEGTTTRWVIAAEPNLSYITVR